MIKNKSEYVAKLHTMTEGGPGYFQTGNGTIEEISAKLVFAPAVDLTSLSPKGYPQAVWNALSTVVSGKPLTAAERKRLDGFKGWMNGQAVDSYGRSFYDQLPKAIGELKSSAETRRAVIVQSPAECLTSLQFAVRQINDDLALITQANFRSLDAMHLPADLYWIQQLRDKVVTILGGYINLQPIIVSAFSFHLYQKDVATVQALS